MELLDDGESVPAKPICLIGNLELPCGSVRIKAGIWSICKSTGRNRVLTEYTNRPVYLQTDQSFYKPTSLFTNRLVYLQTD